MDDELICPICLEEYYSGQCWHLARHIIPLVYSARSWAGQMYVRALAADHELAAETALYQAERAGLLQVIADLREDIAEMNAGEKP